MTPARALRPGPGANPLGGPIVHLDTVGSTNDRARTLAVEGAPHGTLVTAEEQTAGRGRQGRAWAAPRGRSVTASMVVRGEARLLETLPLAAAVAVCEACEHATGVGCTIKWPNDVWIEERKVAGILIEGRPQEGWAVLGIGLNVDFRPEDLAPELRERATSLRIVTGSPVERERVLEGMLARLTSVLAAEKEEVLDEFRTRDALYGRRIAWRAGDRTREGEARGIDDEGRLIVFCEAERLALDAGEVHLVD